MLADSTIAPSVRQIELSDEQLTAVSALTDGVRKGKQTQTLGGYAGTGKTTSIRALKSRLPGFAVCAFTGKAANMLRRKRIPDASTIHSLIYVPESGLSGKVRFRLRYEREMDPDLTGFIVDEASMVGRTIYQDLLSFDLPCIFVGDHGQLEPIERGFNLMADPDYKLEHIHRNSGEIPRFAEWVRLGRDSRDFRPKSDAVILDDPKGTNDQEAPKISQIICAFNKARVALNAQMRRLKGYKNTVEVGERVMCLRNHHDEGIFNGMQGTVTAVRKTTDGLQIDFDTHDGVHEALDIDPDQFGKEKGPGETSNRFLHPFDYAYAITAHKAQGDEWDNVMVLEQKCKLWDHRRWAYTAASRAQRQLIWMTRGGAW